MRIFISYASEQAQAAEPVAIALRNAGHSVFLDKDSLPAAESYDDRIRAAIARSDMFVFLVSPESVTPGRYTLTELKFARERWPKPGNHILPVMVAPTPIADIPPYLTALNIVKPEGNMVAEVAALVEKRGSSGPVLRIAAVVAAVVLVLGGLGAGAWWLSRSAATVATKVGIDAQVAACAVVNELLQVKSPDQLSQAAARQSEMCRELEALQGGDPRERQVADLMAQGEVDKALALLEDMAKQPPQSVERWERLATLSVLRDPDQATRAREAIKALAPADAANQLQLAQLYASSRPEDWVRINQDVLAGAKDPMARAIARWSLCNGSLPLVSAHPEWECDAAHPGDLVAAYQTTQLDKRYASNAAMSVLTARVAMLSVAGMVNGADPEAMINSLVEITDGLKIFSQEQLKYVANPNMGELLKIQADETTITGDMITQMIAAIRAQDLPGVKAAFSSANVKLDAVTARTQALSARFSSPLVTAELASTAHAQGLLLLQETAIGGQAADATQQAAVLAKLREATARFKSIHEQSPKIGVPMVALVLLTQWIQSAGQAQADWIGPEVAADQLMWVNILAQQKPNDPTVRFMLLQAHYLSWKFADAASKPAEQQQVVALLAQVDALGDPGAAKPILDAIRSDIAAGTAVQTPDATPAPN